MALTDWTNPANKRLIIIPATTETLDNFPVKVNLSASCGTSSHDATPIFKELTPISTNDPFFSKNVLLMEMEGADGSTTFTDKYGHTFTAAGDAKLKNTQKYSGNTSAYFDGTGDYISTPSSSDFAFGSDDFTVECCFYISGYATNNSGIYNSALVCKDVLGAREFTFLLSGTVNSFTSLQFTGFSNNSTYIIATASFNFQLNTWYHTSAVRRGNTLVIYVDGKVISSTAFSLTLQNSSAPVKIGANEFDVTYKYYFKGYIDNVRITKAARYIANFSPPNLGYVTTEISDDPDWANVEMAFNFDGANNSTVIQDLKGGICSPAADCKISTVTSKFGGSSVYMDGNEDYLMFAADAHNFILTPKICFEVWLCPTKLSTRIAASGGGAVAWNGTNGVHWLIQLPMSGAINFQFWNGSGFVSNISTLKIPLGVWSFVTVMVSGTTLVIGINGVTETFTISARVKPSSTPVHTNIGTIPGEGGTFLCYQGWMDDFKITLNVDKYLTNFTPPTKSFHHSGIVSPKRLAIESGVTGKQCYTEIEKWDSLNRSAQLWFDSKSLVSGAGGTYALYYDNEHADNVYDPEFYHAVTVGLPFATATSGKGILDYKNKVPTLRGDTKISTTQSKFGVASCYFDGNGDYFSTPDHADFAFGNGDFTVEAWVYLLAYKSYGSCIIDSLALGGDWLRPNAHILYINSSYVASFQNGANRVISSQTVPLNAWTHVCLVRVSGVLKVFIDGVILGSAPYSLNLTDTSCNVGINSPSTADPNAHFYGYMQDLRVTKGVARYTDTFTPPATLVNSFTTQALDPYWGETVLALSMSGANNSTSFIDLKSGTAVSAVGDAKVSTTQYKFGESSAYFDGNGDYLTTPHRNNLNLVSGDFTIECWIFCSGFAGSGNTSLISKDGTAGSTYAQYGVAISNTTQKIVFSVGSGNGVSYTQSLTQTSTLAVGSWHHVAFARRGTTLYLFINGTLEVSATQTGTMVDGGKPLLIGYETGQPTVNYFNGYIDDLRITKGAARYTANFTPAASSFDTCYLKNDTYTSNVSLYMPLDSSSGPYNIVEEKGNTATITGEPTVNTSKVKYGGSSCFFDGVDDFIQYPTSDYYTGVGMDLTIDFWMYALAYDGDLVSMTKSSGWGEQFIKLQSDGTVIMKRNTLNNVYAAAIMTSVSTLSLNAWHHIAVTYTNGMFTLYLDGKADGGVYDSSLIGWINAGNPLEIGRSYNSTAPTLTRYFNGYLSELRITKGAVRWRGNFTPPSSSVFSGTAYNNSVALASPPFVGTNGDYPDAGDWRLTTPTNKPTIYGNKLRFVGTITSEARFRHALIGDFRVTFDLDVVSGPNSNSWDMSAMLKSSSTADRFQVGRYHDSSDTVIGYKNISGSSTVFSNPATASTSCSFKLERIGSTIYLYWKDRSAVTPIWVSLGSSAWISSELYLCFSCGHWTGLISTIGDFYNLNIISNGVSGYIGDIGSGPGQEVWVNGYESVYHLSQDPTSVIKCSNRSDRNLTTYGSMSLASLKRDAVLGWYASFDGVDDYMQSPTGNYSAMQTAFTTEYLGTIGSASGQVLLIVGPVSAGSPTIGRYAASSFINDGIWGDDLQSGISTDVGMKDYGIVLSSGNSRSIGNGVIDTVVNNGVAVGNLSSVSLMLNNGVGVQGAASLKTLKLSNIARSAVWVDTAYKTDFDLLSQLTYPNISLNYSPVGGILMGGSFTLSSLASLQQYTHSPSGGLLFGGKFVVNVVYYDRNNVLRQGLHLMHGTVYGDLLVQLEYEPFEVVDIAFLPVGSTWPWELYNLPDRIEKDQKVTDSFQDNAPIDFIHWDTGTAVISNVLDITASWHNGVMLLHRDI